jgi:hypothetical protein
MKPYIVSITNITEGLEVTINHERQWEATVYARDYFGDKRTDYRNRNIVEYQYSDFDHNHTYRVTLPSNHHAV